MRICDLTEEQIHVGLRIRSLIDYNHLATVVKREDKGSETYWWILWDGEKLPFSGFFWNDCECEVVEESL
jgi:hypothetical protein